MTAKLVKLTDICHVLGLPATRLQGLARSGWLRAKRFTSVGRGPCAGNYYVTTTEACRILREMLLEGADLAAGRRAVYRASKRVAESTRNTGLHEVGAQVGKVTPGTE